MAIAIRMIPANVYAESKKLASQRSEEAKPTNWLMGGLVLASWAAAVAIVVYIVIRSIKKR